MDLWSVDWFLWSCSRTWLQAGGLLVSLVLLDLLFFHCSICLNVCVWCWRPGALLCCWTSCFFTASLNIALYLNIWENNNRYVLYCCFMLHCCLNCPFWLHENQAKCCQNLQLNGLFLGSWKIRFHRLEPKPNRITRNRNSSVPHFQRNRSVPSSQVTELAEEPKNRTDRFRLTERPDLPKRDDL